MVENLVIFHEVFGADSKYLADMILVKLREIREKGLRQIEEKQKGKVLN